MPSTAPYIVLALLSGAAFSLIGISYRVAQARGIAPTRVALLLAAFGALVFAVRCIAASVPFPPAFVILIGVIMGLTQFVSFVGLRSALAIGPLSPAWCAVSLNFLLPVFYASLLLRERQGGWAWAGVAAGAGAVVAGAIAQRAAQPAEGARNPSRHPFAYAALLIVIVVANSFNNTALKMLEARADGDGVTYLARYAMAAIMIMYVVLAAGLVANLAILRQLRGWTRRAAGYGALAAIGSAGGLTCISLCVGRLPAAVAFTLGGIASILGGTLVSVLFLGERISRAWYVMLALALAAVVMAGIGR